MRSYSELARTFRELCDEYNVTEPVGTSQELTQAERVNNVDGYLSVAEDEFPKTDAADTFIGNCQKFFKANE